MSDIKYKRVLLKLSGEALAGDQKTGINAETVGKICDQIKILIEIGVEVSIVVGGGNFWRGSYGLNMERTTSDYMGMLATAMNGLALQDALESRGIYTRLQQAIEMREIAERYIKRKALKHLNKKSSYIFLWNRKPLLYYRYSSSLKSSRNRSRYNLTWKNNRWSI